MKIIAWAFFCMYCLGLLVSVLPLVRIGAIWAILGLSYIGFAQFWLIWTNRERFRGFFRSSIFHIIPVLILTYIIGSQMLYFLLSDDAENKLQQLALSLVSLVLPFIMIWSQYALFSKAFKPSGILNNHD